MQKWQIVRGKRKNQTNIIYVGFSQLNFLNKMRFKVKCARILTRLCQQADVVFRSFFGLEKLTCNDTR